MTAGTFLTLLFVFSVLTSLITEGVKMFLDSMKIRYASNVVVLVIAMLTGMGGVALYYVNYQIPFNALNSVYLALMGGANWLTAMLGYDKIRQALEQIRDMGR